MWGVNMAEEKQQTYPDIPISQWWKIRGLFRNRLVDTINLKYLQDALGVKPQSARGIYRNLQLFGFIDKDGKTTDRANHWRVDDQYLQVCKDIMTEIYPVGLLDAPVETTERGYLIDWFVRNTRVGENFAAKNASVFELLREADVAKGKETKATAAGPAKPPARKPNPAKPASAAAVENPVAAVVPPIHIPPEVKPEKPSMPERITPTVHIDIQLHISPEAPTAQIEEIFAAIERHLYKQRSGE
jgi:hypothetical protein